MVPRVRKWFELVKVKLPAKISMYMCANNACTIIGDRTSEGTWTIINMSSGYFKVRTYDP